MKRTAFLTTLLALGLSLLLVSTAFAGSRGEGGTGLPPGFETYSVVGPKIKGTMILSPDAFDQGFADVTFLGKCGNNEHGADVLIFLQNFQITGLSNDPNISPWDNITKANLKGVTLGLPNNGINVVCGIATTDWFGQVMYVFIDKANDIERFNDLNATADGFTNFGVKSYSLFAPMRGVTADVTLRLLQPPDWTPVP